MLWTGYIAKNDTIYNAVYSIFDEELPLQFTAIPQNTHLIEPYTDDRAMEALLWFSDGFYTVRQSDDTLVFYDLRFGRDDFWLTDEGTYIWANEIILNEQGEAFTFEQTLPPLDTRTQNLVRYWNRIWSNRN